MLATEQIAAWVGLDWAEDQHEIRLRAAGSREVERCQVRQDPEELHEWVRQLRTRFEGRPVVIALEQKRGGLMAALMCYDFLHLYPINPKTVASYREAFSPSGKKDDPEDSDLLLELVYRHRDRLRCWRPEAAQTRELALLVEGRRQLVEERKRLVQQLREVFEELLSAAFAVVCKVGWATGSGVFEALAQLGESSQSADRCAGSLHGTTSSTLCRDEAANIARADPCQLPTDPG